ncbi:putative signal transduction protein with EAL and GGDEF domain [Desulfitispora alkaliphila]
MLIKVAQILQKLESHQVSVYRLSGDEFILLYENTCEYEKIKTLIQIEEKGFNIRCSIGIALYPKNSSNPINLIRYADFAVRSVKTEPHNSYAFYNNTMGAQLDEKKQIEKWLHEALLKNDFKMLYQPKVCVDDVNITGFEVLLRINGRNISPAKFIPIAEEVGLIIKIGRWVTREAVYGYN